MTEPRTRTAIEVADHASALLDELQASPGFALKATDTDRFLGHLVERLAAQLEDLAAYVHAAHDDGEVVVDVDLPEVPPTLTTVDHLKAARKHLGDALHLEGKSGDQFGLSDRIARPAIDLHQLLEDISEGRI